MTQVQGAVVASLAEHPGKLSAGTGEWRTHGAKTSDPAESRRASTECEASAACGAERCA